MRPTDEDQPGSKRPNLMASSRRNAGDVNILAMLDGLGTRPHAKRTMLWLGAGAILVCGLIVTVAWLAHEPATHLDASMVEGGLPPAPALLATAASASPDRLAEATPAPFEPASEPPPVPASGAAIVNVAAESVPAASEPAATANPEPAERPHAVVMPKLVPALQAPAPKSPAAHLTPPRRAVAKEHPAGAHPSPRRSAPAIKPVPAPAAVDTDVALISAIIQHAARQREAIDDNGCGDKPCGPRMPAQP